MLEIRDLHASVAGTPILKGLNLTVRGGEVHAIMGPNGAGKSTLSKVLAGSEEYEVTSGSVSYLGQDLFSLSIEERAAAGLFLGFQYPVEIPGVTNSYFLKTAINAQRKVRGEEEIGAGEFIRLLKDRMAFLEMDPAFRNRFVNVGFSGGEKKRNEVLQLLMLEPKLALLDETDSGLDIDALRVVAKGVNSVRGQGKAIVVVTHYQRLLDYIVPDQVHVLVDGRIVQSGDKGLALELEEHGYAASRQGAPVGA
jgi:Fe-S cluster assembly ATP-binding protein